MVRPADPTAPGPWGFILGEYGMTRVAAFIDGFNLYHALDKLGWNAAARTKSHKYKWLNLWALMDRLVAGKSEELVAVHYFSAYAKWLQDPHERHQKYVAALETVGVNVVMGHFKAKDRYCRKCGASWTGYEEKETDVNIGLWILNEARKGRLEKVLLVSRDSDQKPTVEMIRREFPKIDVWVVAPPELGHSNDLLQVATGRRKINRKQIEACLFDKVVFNGAGKQVAVRPDKYDPNFIEAL